MKADIDFTSQETIEKGLDSLYGQSVEYKGIKLTPTVFLSSKDYQLLIKLVFVANKAPAHMYKVKIREYRCTKWQGVGFIEIPVEREATYSNYVHFGKGYEVILDSWSEEDSCDCSNCTFKSGVGIKLPCMKEALPPSSTGTPMPPCKPPKQEDNLSEYKALKKMLEHFKEKNDLNNKSLAAFGESRHCSPLTTIDVQELKDYMLTILEKEMNL